MVLNKYLYSYCKINIKLSRICSSSSIGQKIFLNKFCFHFLQKADKILVNSYDFKRNG